MIIGVDVDGCLADFNTGFINCCVTVTGRDAFPPRPFDITVWDYPQYYGYTDEEVLKVWQTIEADEEFWTNLQPYADTHDSLTYLKHRQVKHDSRDDIYFVTARVGVEAKAQTEWWLECHGFRNPTVLISGAKSMVARALKFDSYIDDNWENVVAVSEYSDQTRTFLLVQPWNRGNHPSMFGITEVSSINNFLD